MQLRDSRRAAEDLAGDLDVVDDQALDTLRADEMLAAWAYIYQQADLYAADVEETLAGDAMLQPHERSSETMDPHRSPPTRSAASTARAFV